MAKIAARGWRLYDETFNAQQEKSTPPEPTKNEQKPPDAVYYIVEKKRRRSRPSYGDPKEFRFK
ncbi:MAG: hypothetical protein IJV83_02470 [Clostridia bacterium]|nr:hypothetical protein [Clostridia bacterium]